MRAAPGHGFPLDIASTALAPGRAAGRRAPEMHPRLDIASTALAPGRGRGGGVGEELLGDIRAGEGTSPICANFSHKDSRV